MLLKQRSLWEHHLFKLCLGTFARGKTFSLVGAAISVTTILGYSAMAGIVGGGGLGAIAMNYGYYRYQQDIMFYNSHTSCGNCTNYAGSRYENRYNKRQKIIKSFLREEKK